jgi:hypothetical protein
MNGAADAGVGLDTNAYSFNNGSWQASASYTTGANGTVSVRVRDILGNINTGSYSVTNIDTTAPTIQSVTYNPAQTNWGSGDVTVTVTLNETGGAVA